MEPRRTYKIRPPLQTFVEEEAHASIGNGKVFSRNEGHGNPAAFVRSSSNGSYHQRTTATLQISIKQNNTAMDLSL